LKKSLRKWFFKEPWFERFFVEPEMVLPWPHSEEPFSVPDAPPWFCVLLYDGGIYPEGISRLFSSTLRMC